MTASDHDPDLAQARVFVDHLETEVEILSQRIESVKHLAHEAQAGGRGDLVARFKDESASLRGQLYQAHRLIDRLVLRFPHARPASGSRHGAS